MGFWDSITGGSQEEQRSAPAKSKQGNPFAVTLGFHPLRLSSHDSNSINLMIKVKNVSGDVQLASVDALLPRDAMLGFDKPGINKGMEKRLGELKPGQSMEVSLPIWANNQSKEGKYDVEVTVYSHYIGYNKVLSYLKKKASFRVV